MSAENLNCPLCGSEMITSGDGTSARCPQCDSKLQFGAEPEETAPTKLELEGLKRPPEKQPDAPAPPVETPPPRRHKPRPHVPSRPPAPDETNPVGETSTRLSLFEPKTAHENPIIDEYFRVTRSRRPVKRGLLLLLYALIGLALVLVVAVAYLYLTL